VTDEGADTSATGERDALTSELRDRLRYVEGQLEAERQSHAEARRLLMAALERIPALEAPAPQEVPPDAPPAPETATAEADRVSDRPGPAGPQTPVQRPWWRRIIDRR
jgi:hypothetical protein